MKIYPADVKRATMVAMGIGFGLTALILCLKKIGAIYHADKFQSVLLTGRHHMGPNFNISDFYVDGYPGSNVGREGGGGSSVCCVLLPKTWRPGLAAEVRWQVGDWTHAHGTVPQFGGDNGVKWKNYKASVPVEYYKTAEHLYVHFFDRGRARIVSSVMGTRHPQHPIPDGDSSAQSEATQGVPIPDLFAKVEFGDRKIVATKEGAQW